MSMQYCAEQSNLHCDTSSPSPYVYYPFGFGHRSCIGRVFAMVSIGFQHLLSQCSNYLQIEAKVVIVHLLRNFNISLPEDYCLKLAPTQIMQPVEGLPCFLTSKI